MVYVLSVLPILLGPLVFYERFHEVKTATFINAAHLSVRMGIHTLHHRAPLTQWVDAAIPVADVAVVFLLSARKHAVLVDVSRRLDWKLHPSNAYNGNRAENRDAGEE